MTDDGAHLLPGVLREVAEEAGVRAALKLADAFGGRELYVPFKLTDEHPIVEAIGKEASAKMVKLYGGGRVLVPLDPNASASRQKRTIVKMLREGKSVQTIAGACGCHIRTVLRVKADKDDGDQFDLFARR